MDKFIKSYQGKIMEDGKTGLDDFKKIKRAFKAAIKREFPDAVLTGFKANPCSYVLDGFIEEKGTCAYVFCGWDPESPLDLLKGEPFGGILVRIAKGSSIQNHYCSYPEFSARVRMLQRMQMEGWNAKFTSVWDQGREVTTNCYVDRDTHEIVEVEPVEDPEVEILIREYVTIDGEEFPAVRKDELLEYYGENVFWFE